LAATTRVLFSSSLARLSDFRCDTPRSGCGCEMCDARSSVTIVRRGVHAYHARGRAALAAPGNALLYRGGEPYRLSHPYHRDVPDLSTCVEFGDALLEEVFGPTPLARDLGTRLRPQALVLTREIVAALAGGTDRLAAEEGALAIVRAVAEDFGLAREDDRKAGAARRIERARAFVAAAPEAGHGLEAVAAAAACSPFHLARLFRRHTGMTIHGYRLWLRLVLALERLAEGERDLAGLAAALGFSHHSHLTAAFRKAFGVPPSALRERLRSAGLRQVSRILTAQAAAGAQVEGFEHR
jgi:AraC family transcriptional regulator